MTARPTQRLARSAPWALRLAALPVPLVILAGLLHRQGLIDLPSFFASLGLAWALAAGALVLAALALRVIWLDGSAGLRPALLAALLALVVLALPVAIVVELVSRPRLADVTTDPIDPPLFTVAPESVTMRPLPGERANFLQASAYPDIVPRHYALSPARVFQAISALVAERGWHVSDQRAPDSDNEVGWIEADGTTRIFALPVDVVIRVIGDDEGTLVDMRSASRIGAHDLGDNADRIRAFFAALDGALQGVTDTDVGGDDTDGDTPADAAGALPPLPVPSPISAR